MLVVAAPESEARFVVDAGWESITVLLSLQDVRAHLTARQRQSEFRLPQGIETLQVTEKKARQLFGWGKRFEIGADQGVHLVKWCPSVWINRRRRPTPPDSASGWPAAGCYRAVTSPPASSRTFGRGACPRRDARHPVGRWCVAGAVGPTTPADQRSVRARCRPGLPRAGSSAGREEPQVRRRPFGWSCRAISEAATPEPSGRRRRSSVRPTRRVPPRSHRPPTGSAISIRFESGSRR